MIILARETKINRKEKEKELNVQKCVRKKAYDGVEWKTWVFSACLPPCMQRGVFCFGGQG